MYALRITESLKSPLNSESLKIAPDDSQWNRIWLVSSHFPLLLFHV